MNRPQIHASFIKRFAPPTYRIGTSISLESVRRVESLLDTTFPDSYVTFITTYGAVQTPGILNLIVAANELGLTYFEGWDIAEFLSLVDVPSLLDMNVKAGMGESLIPFAATSCGNLFGFHKSATSADDGEVLLFDHDFCEIHVEAESFDKWIARFLTLE